MYKIFTLALLYLWSGLSWAQDCTPWFPFEEGTRFEYSFFNKKDKFTGKVAYEITNLSQQGKDYQATVQARFYDKKEEEYQDVQFEVACEGGVYRANISNFINPALTEMFGDAEVKVSGDALVLPANLEVGQSLPDAHSSMTATLGIIDMTMEMQMTDRKVVERVSVETPVKTFQTYHITATESVKTTLFNRETTAHYYYAEGYGQVKSEVYDKKDRLDSYMLLTQFERP